MERPRPHLEWSFCCSLHLCRSAVGRAPCQEHRSGLTATTRMASSLWIQITHPPLHLLITQTGFGFCAPQWHSNTRGDFLCLVCPGCLSVAVPPRTGSPEPCGSSSSRTGRSRVCQNQEKVSLISSARSIRPRSSLARMAPSLSIAGRFVPMAPSHSALHGKEQKEFKSQSSRPLFPAHLCRQIFGGVWRGGCQTLASATQTHIPSGLGTAHKAFSPLYLRERYELLVL